MLKHDEFWYWFQTLAFGFFTEKCNHLDVICNRRPSGCLLLKMQEVSNSFPFLSLPKYQTNWSLITYQLHFGYGTKLMDVTLVLFIEFAEPFPRSWRMDLCVWTVFQRAAYAVPNQQPDSAFSKLHWSILWVSCNSVKLRPLLLVM